MMIMIYFYYVMLSDDVNVSIHSVLLLQIKNTFMFYYFVLDIISIYYMILPFALVPSVFISIVIIGCRAIKPESKEFQRPLDR